MSTFENTCDSRQLNQFLLPRWANPHVCSLSIRTLLNDFDKSLIGMDVYKNKTPVL